MPEMDRRDFLKKTAIAGGAAALLGGAGLGAYEIDKYASGRNPREIVDSVLEHPAAESGIDHVVVLMMENRSFDHYLGWLGSDEKYLEAGTKKHGKSFSIAARQSLEYPDIAGEFIDTYPLVPGASETGIDAARGCDHPIPGHGWYAGRAQKERGFLGRGTGNDKYAISYYRREDLPLYAALADRFTVCDHYHSSALGATFINRQYQHSAQSGGNRTIHFQLGTGYQWATIWDRLARAGVSAGYYYVDLPVLLLWGPRMKPFVHRAEHFFEDAQKGTLPSVTFIDPGFTTSYRTDEHPHGDIHLGQRFVRQALRSVMQGPQWDRTLLVLTYDEWGGFFDHVVPPTVPDALASPVLNDDFGQMGFRVPTFLVSPHVQRTAVDHTLYGHESTLRFLEWRFLGAPPTGPGKKTDDWFLTTRDRYANNLGSVIGREKPDPDLDFDIDMAILAPSPPCIGVATEDGFAPLAPGDLDPGPDPDIPLDTPRNEFRYFVEQGYLESIGEQLEPGAIGEALAALSPTGSL
jgi:phospholipase C